MILTKNLSVPEAEIGVEVDYTPIINEDIFTGSFVEHQCFDCIVFDSDDEKKQYIDDYKKRIKERRMRTLVDEGVKIDDDNEIELKIYVYRDGSKRFSPVTTPFGMNPTIKMRHLMQKVREHIINNYISEQQQNL